MPSDTPKLGLKKPEEGSFGWQTAWYDNMDKLDAHPGIKAVTSTTRPEEPWPGQVVFEIDTRNLMLFDGEAWRVIQLEAV
ncbi:MAG: hypothetical protein PHV30_10725 [Candidatus Margulisbacteria bacterium]|nr:hypothetical protein [Candidatus Margulisiibacteriota bacterium]